MTSDDQKVILAIGGTGAQGAAVVKGINLHLISRLNYY
jgi:hypothetical protein